MTPKIIAYTDGGSRNNPGAAGSGAYIIDAEGNVLKKAWRALGVATNNVAEYTAVILALEEIKKLVPEAARKDAEIEIRMDSELVCRQMMGRYKIKAPGLKPLYADVRNLIIDFPKTKFVHVRRELNKDADALSNVAMDESEKMLASAKEGLFK
ncbi:MAG: ribonuclease HI family protein [Patescibacteria group bacterium]